VTMNTFTFRILLASIITTCGVMVYKIVALPAAQTKEIDLFKKAMIAETKFLEDRLVNYNKRIQQGSRHSDREEVKTGMNHAKQVMIFYDSAKAMIDKIRSSSNDHRRAQRYMDEYSAFVKDHEPFLKGINQHANDPINRYLFSDDNRFSATYLQHRNTSIELGVLILEYDLADCMYEHLQKIVTFAD